MDLGRRGWDDRGMKIRKKLRVTQAENEADAASKIRSLQAAFLEITEVVSSPIRPAELEKLGVCGLDPEVQPLPPHYDFDVEFDAKMASPRDAVEKVRETLAKAADILDVTRDHEVKTSPSTNKADIRGLIRQRGIEGEKATEIEKFARWFHETDQESAMNALMDLLAKYGQR
jgi:hypothetical protein